MVQTIKHAVKKSVVQNKRDWEEALPQVLYGSRRRKHGKAPSLLRFSYGINPRMMASDAVFALTEAEPKHPLVQMFKEYSLRAAITAKSIIPRNSRGR